MHVAHVQPIKKSKKNHIAQVVEIFAKNVKKNNITWQFKN